MNATQVTVSATERSVSRNSGLTQWQDEQPVQNATGSAAVGRPGRKVVRKTNNHASRRRLELRVQQLPKLYEGGPPSGMEIMAIAICFAGGVNSITITNYANEISTFKFIPNK
jgi:hypothetical protein